MRQIITSFDLDALFGPTRRDAQELLPQLVRRLIAHSCEDRELLRFRMPAGDDIRVPGWDGELTFTGVHPCVPTGVSGWEMGVSSDPKAKADDDYAKRKANPQDIDPASATFVFVTPRVWANRDNWVTEKKADGYWADVRVIDATDIATWLERCPVVAIWIADNLGRQIRGIDSLDRYWEKCLANKYSTQVTPQLILGGRSNEADKLAAWLGSPSDSISMVGETVEEATFFAAAVCKQLGSKIGEGGLPLLFVSSSLVSEHLGALGQDHVVVLTDPALFAQIRSESLAHLHILIPEKREARVNSTRKTIELGPLVRTEITEALKKSGVGDDEAGRIAGESKGSLHAVLWMVAKPERGALNWSSGTAARELAPLVLAGQWTIENHADHEVISEIARRSYSDVRQTLAVWSGPGNPIEKRGRVWDWKAWDFAWVRLVPSLDPSEILRFKQIVQEVLGTPDPALELSPEDRWLADLRGKTHKYSKELRQGLAQSVALLAVNRDSISGVDGQAVANALVQSLLQTGDRARTWLSVSQWLPDLAEAAPDVFLDSLEQLTADQASLDEIFTEGGIFGHSPHTYVLWALERLAWSREYLARVVLALGALATVDPGGQISNRPAGSLRMIFLPWHPATRATADDRIDALRLLFDRTEDVAWGCAASLLPKGHDVGAPFARPKWRGWATERETDFSQDYWEFERKLVDLLIERAGTHGNRWADLLKGSARLVRQQPELATRIIESLKRLDPASLQRGDAFTLGDAARELVMRHENLSEADWSLKGAELEPFRELRDQFVPAEPRDRHRWLFTQWPEVAREYDLPGNEREQKLAQLRQEAVDAVMSQEGIEGILAWSSEVENAAVLGGTIALVGLPLTDESILIQQSFGEVGTARDRPPLAWLGYGYVSRKVATDGDAWRDNALETLDIRGPRSLAFFAEALPRNRSTWEFLDEQDEAVQEAYWSQVFLIHLDIEECEVAFPRLQHANRPFTMMDLVGMLLHRYKQEGSSESDGARIVALARTALDCPLDHLPKDECCHAGSMIAHHVDEALAFVELHGAEQSELAAWEWKWLPFVEDAQRGLKSLHAELSKNPELFVEALKCVYKAEDEDHEGQESDEQTRARAQLAYKLLESWNQVPGLAAGAQCTPDNSIGEGMRPSVPEYVGTVDGEVLSQWVAEARRLAAQAKRLAVCNRGIGRQFAYAPGDSDGSWPCEAVRQRIEALGDEEVDQGFVRGVWRRRGTHYAGRPGEQEARLAAQFRDWCEKVRLKAPRTGVLLRQLAEDYEQDAKREIERGRLEEYDL